MANPAPPLPPTLERASELFPSMRNVNPPLPPAHATAKIVAKWAVLFFLLSLIAIPVIHYFDVTDYQLIPFIVGGLSLITFLIATFCRTTCGKITETPEISTPQGTSPQVRTSTPRSSLSSTSWISAPPTPASFHGEQVRFREFESVVNINLIPIVVLNSKNADTESNRRVREQAKDIQPIVDALQAPFSIENVQYSNLIDYLAKAKDSTAISIKKVLWTLCVKDENSLTTLGENLLKSGQRHLFIQNPDPNTKAEEALNLNNPLYCNILKPNNTVLSLTQGEIAFRLMELRTHITSLMEETTVQSNTPAQKLSDADLENIKKRNLETIQKQKTLKNAL